MSFTIGSGIDKEHFQYVTSNVLPRLLTRSLISLSLAAVLSVIILGTSIPVSAIRENGVIELVFSENAPIIDGRWTTEDEWLDATVTEVSEQGQTIFLLVKHDRDHVYFLFDAVTDQTRYVPHPGGSGPLTQPLGGAHIAMLLFDTDNDGAGVDNNDVWLPYGIGYNEEGEEQRFNPEPNTFYVGNSETNDWVETFEPGGFDHAYSTVSRNSAYEPGREHYIHEFRVPLSFLHKHDEYGFSVDYFVGPFLPSDQFEQTRVTWPLTATRDNPSSWGSLLSPTNSVTAPPVPVMSVSANDLSFGNVVVSEKSDAKSITIVNRGTSDLRINSIRAAGEFSVTGISTPTVIQPGESATFQVAFAPLSLGDKPGLLSIVSNDLTSPTYTISLEGEGVEKAEILAGGGCLIATAAYGSEFAPQVQMLREIRDNQLLKTSSGSAFMSAFNSFYYSWSPTVAEWERQNPLFKESVRVAITPLIATLSILPHVSMDSEEEALGYGIGVILLNIGIYFVAPAFAVMFIRSRKRKGAADQ